MARSPGSFVPALLMLGVAAATISVAVPLLMNLPLGPEQAVSPLLFTLLTGVLLTWQESAMQQGMQGFVVRFMTGLVVKMMASLLVLLVVVLILPKPRVLPFALPFVATYLVFLGFSVVRLTRMLRQPPAA